MAALVAYLHADNGSAHLEAANAALRRMFARQVPVTGHSEPVIAAQVVAKNRDAGLLPDTDPVEVYGTAGEYLGEF